MFFISLFYSDVTGYIIVKSLPGGSLVPRPLPDFISQPIFLHGCDIKSGSGLGTRLVLLF